MQNTNEKLEYRTSAGFYELDVAYIGAPCENKQGTSTEKQAFLVILSTSQEHKYPMHIKLLEIEKDNGSSISTQLRKFVKMSKDRILNTDGKTTYNILKKYINCKK